MISFGRQDRQVAAVKPACHHCALFPKIQAVVLPALSLAATTLSFIFPIFNICSAKNLTVLSSVLLLTLTNFWLRCFNYTFKECISVEKLRLWLLILTKTLFLMTILIKLTLGTIFIKVEKIRQGSALSQNS